MNPSEADRRTPADSTREIRALVELCQALAGSGLYVELSDARPALSVRAELAGKRLWISVEGETFIWRRMDEVHHAAGDPAGAAAEIVAYLGGRTGRLDDRP
ncbi:hypothetical protein GCM10023196_056060 [Actinoallomurus vinaceus]|uniref:Uncharacterized protein n=1 Tax=Actinoallomurus vinaceus TaxID=1080074 RepID=A0ABP8UI38_9ACTN